MTQRDPHSKARLSGLMEGDEEDFGSISYNDKIKVDCICPKCGKKHVMVFHWIGRGIPRKYCPSCKGRFGQ